MCLPVLHVCVPVCLSATAAAAATLCHIRNAFLLLAQFSISLFVRLLNCLALIC